MAELKIQEDYWTGSKCLENEVPWQTPGSIITENEILSPNDHVLEIGSGGSTLFFARRCKSVVSIETEWDYAESVSAAILEKGIANTTLMRASGGGTGCKTKDACALIRSLPRSKFTVLSVDPMSGVDRSQLFDEAIEICRDSVRIVVLDNYADETLFKTHWNKSAEEMITIISGGKSCWRCETHDDRRWFGRGTRVYIKCDEWT